MTAAAPIDVSEFFFQQIEQQQLELPVLPGVAAEVMSLCEDPNTDAARLSKVIHKDQTLASSVLRVANSTAYAGQVPCASLQQAVSRLGMQMVTEIALAVTVKGRVFNNALYVDLLRGLWRHSVITGLYTKEIARMRRQNVESAFLAGLLHDVGKAVLLANLDRCHGGRLHGVRMDELVRALHEHHTAAGGMLALEWGLPEQLTEAIVCHHEFERATRYADMTMMVCLGDLMSHMTVPVAGGPRYEDETIQRHPVIAGLNLYPDQLAELVQRGERIQAVAEAVG